MLVGLVPRVAAAAPQPLRAARAVGLADVGRRQILFQRRGELAREVVDAVVVRVEPRQLSSILRGEVDRLVAGPEGLPQLGLELDIVQEREGTRGVFPPLVLAPDA